MTKVEHSFKTGWLLIRQSDENHIVKTVNLIKN
jgi:hypothetical protein